MKIYLGTGDLTENGRKIIAEALDKADTNNRHPFVQAVMIKGRIDKVLEVKTDPDGNPLLNADGEPIMDWVNV